ncbi:MAG: amidohydrolase family protein, partial [Dehalococcoidia bacterium]
HRFKITDTFDDYAQVISLAHPALEDLAGPDVTPELARVANDSMAELVAKHPDRFVGAVAALPLNNIEASLLEIDRVINDLGCKGVQLFTNVNGKPLDSPEFMPIFEAMARHDRPIWLHTARSPAFADYATEDTSKYQVYFNFGWPYETGAAMTRILFTGIFDRHPNLKIITHHLGGIVPYFEERINGTYDQFRSRQQPGETENPLDRLQKRPIDYFKMFYGDTAVYGSIPAMECGLAFFGTDHVLFGSDFPFDAEGGARYIRDTIKSMEGMTASREDKQKIYEGNAREFLKLA